MGLVSDRWGFTLSKPGFRYFEPIYADQRTEATEMPLHIGQIAFPCTRLPDGEEKSKYRNPGPGLSETPAVRNRSIYLFAFSVAPCLRGAKVLFFGCCYVALCFWFCLTPAF